MKLTYKFTRKEAGLWILLAVAACFAIGSVGFFLATILEKNVPNTVLDLQRPAATQEEKDAAMQSLALSEASSTSPDIATKLQILAQLNAQ